MPGRRGLASRKVRISQPPTWTVFHHAAVRCVVGSRLRTTHDFLDVTITWGGRSTRGRDTSPRVMWLGLSPLSLFFLTPNVSGRRFGLGENEGFPSSLFLFPRGSPPRCSPLVIPGRSIGVLRSELIARGQRALTSAVRRNGFDDYGRNHGRHCLTKRVEDERLCHFLLGDYCTKI